MRKKGVVTRFGANGYGFINEMATGKEWFAHVSDVVGHFALMAGQHVEFEEHPRSQTDRLRAGLIEIILAPVAAQAGV